MKIILDLAKDLIRIDKEKLYYFSINQDKSKSSEFYDPKDESNETIFKNWEYVTHGTIFEIKETGSDQA